MKQEKDCTCAYCLAPVKEKIDGGEMKLPMAVTNLPSKMVMLHSKCLVPFLKQCEANRKPITDRTIFQGGGSVR